MVFGLELGLGIVVRGWLGVFGVVGVGGFGFSRILYHKLSSLTLYLLGNLGVCEDERCGI